MFKINVITIGKNKETWVAEAIIHYRKMLRKYAELSFTYIPDKSRNKKMTEAETIQLEAELILGKINTSYPIALSDKGKKMNSPSFADWLNGLMQREGSIDMIIGGIYGLDQAVMKACRESLSLSPMTMSHQLIRPVLLEQLYRGFSILSGGKYHK